MLLGNAPGSYQQNENSYWMFPGSSKSHSVQSRNLEATPRMLFFVTSSKNHFFLLLISDTLAFLFLQEIIFDRSTGFSLSICVDEICDSCLSDWTFWVFHLQFASSVVKGILTTLSVDTFRVKCTYCLFTFPLQKADERVRECVHKIEI